MGTAKVTGCRPGMAMNDANDLADADSPWHELPPLQMGDLFITMDEVAGDGEYTGHGTGARTHWH